MAIKAQAIADTFGVSLFSANLALLIIRGRVKPADHPARFPKTAAWLNRCYHQPHSTEIKLAALDELLGTYGVETIDVPGAWVSKFYGSAVASYLNTGDTYRCTLLIDHDSCRWKLTSWGDWFEAFEAAHPELVEA